MEKPGQRNTQIRIINQPELKSARRHVLEGIITALLWSVWLYCIFPVINLLFRLAGIGYIEWGMFTEPPSKQLLEIIKGSALVFVSILFIQACWISYNYFLLHKLKRNKNNRHISPPESASAPRFDVDPGIFNNMKEASIIHITLNGDKLILKTDK